MDARSVRTTAEAKALVEERGLSHVKLGIVDLDGVIRGKYLARDKFVGALEAGFSFCDIVFGWDSNDQMYDNGAFTGWHTAFPDAIARIDPSTCRDVPTEENMPRQMPFRVAMEFALTGEFFGAERAYQLGIINRVTDGPALDAALELAAAIGANGPLAVKASKQVIVESRLWPEDEMWKRQQEIVGPVFVSEDAREGAAAFAEKRPPNWKGK